MGAAAGRRAGWAIATGAVLLLAAPAVTACTGSSTRGREPAASSSTAVTVASATSAAVRTFDPDPFSPDAAYDDFAVGPLAELLGRGAVADDGVTRQAEGSQTRQRAAEAQARAEVVAECMRAAGFEYVVAEFAEPAVAPGAGLSRREFAERYGFGISTTFEDGVAAGGASAAGAPVAGAGTDPNAEYVESLSPEEREAYLAALYGAPGEPAPAPTGLDPQTTDTTAPPAPGCAAAVIEPPVTEDQFFVIDLENRMAVEIDAPVAADPRVTDARERYAQCMSDEGFPDIVDPEAGPSEITRRMEPLYASLSTSFSTASSVPPFDRALLEEIEADEIAQATADLACGEDLERVAFEVRSEYELRFIDAHGAELERYRELTSG